MFTRNEKPSSEAAPGQPQPPAAPRKGPPSVISTTLHVTGNLKSDGEIQIDGTVEGDVACHRLTIGEQADISGEISAEEVVVRGGVNGRIRARTVQLEKSAKVTGDIWHDTLSIEAGAFLEGVCKRNDSAAGTTSAGKAASQRPPAPQPLSGTAQTGAGAMPTATSGAAAAQERRGP